MIKELHMLPESLLEQQSVKIVDDMYLKTFEDLSDFYHNGMEDQQILSKYVLFIWLV